MPFFYFKCHDTCQRGKYVFRIFTNFIQILSISIYYLHTSCLSGHHHNGFMATGALGHIDIYPYIWMCPSTLGVQ